MKTRKRKPRHFISEQTISRGADLRKAGFSWSECSEMMGEKMQSLRSALDRNGVPAYGKKGALEVIPADVIAQARELRAQRVPWKNIERQLGFKWVSINSRICVENRKAKANAQ